MKLLCKKLLLPVNTSFSIIVSTEACLDEHLHFHPECELVFVVKGHGTKLVGDSMNLFDKGDLTLLGANVPHLWRNASCFGTDATLETEMITITFSQDFLGKDFFGKNEMRHIQQLLTRAKSGINIKGDAQKAIGEKIISLLTAKPFDQVLIFLNILDLLANSSELQELSSQGYSQNFQTETDRMENIYTYLVDHFKDDVRLEEIASVACLSTSAFCKYFKKRTKKTFSEFLNELKIGHACKMLIERDCSVAEICYESGFQSLTNFNRQFKNLTSYTPYEYRSKYVTNSPNCFLSEKRSLARAS